MILKLLWSLALACLAISVGAETAAPTPMPSVVPSWGTVLLGLLAVVGTILAVYWLLKQLRLPGVGGRPDWRVLAMMNLGGRERIMLVQVGKEQVLLGVTPQAVNVLARYDQPVLVEEVASANFAEQLRQALGKPVIKDQQHD